MVSTLHCCCFLLVSRIGRHSSFSRNKAEGQHLYRNPKPSAHFRAALVHALSLSSWVHTPHSTLHSMQEYPACAHRTYILRCITRLLRTLFSFSVFFLFQIYLKVCPQSGQWPSSSHVDCTRIRPSGPQQLLRASDQ